MTRPTPFQAAREALAKIAAIRLPTNDRRSALWARDVATEALALIDSALASSEPATPPGDEVEAVAFALYLLDHNWIERVRRQKWDELPDDDITWKHEDGEPDTSPGKNSYRQRAKTAISALDAHRAAHKELPK